VYRLVIVMVIVTSCVVFIARLRNHIQYRAVSRQRVRRRSSIFGKLNPRALSGVSQSSFCCSITIRRSLGFHRARYVVLGNFRPGNRHTCYSFVFDDCLFCYSFYVKSLTMMSGLTLKTDGFVRIRPGKKTANINMLVTASVLGSHIGRDAAA